MPSLITAQSRDFEVDTTVGQWADFLGTGSVEWSDEESYSGSASLKGIFNDGVFGLSVVAPSPQVDNVADGTVLNLVSHHLVPTGSMIGEAFLFVLLGLPEGGYSAELVSNVTETEGVWNTLSGTYIIPGGFGVTKASIGLSIGFETFTVGPEVRYYDAMTFEIPSIAAVTAKPLRQRQNQKGK